LQSGYNALFAFWTLILFGSWTGFQSGVALPAWMPSLSSAATLMLLVPALTIALCERQTGQGYKSPDGVGTPRCFTGFGLWSLVLALVLMAITSCPDVSRVTDFTWYGQSHTLLRLYGFFAMTAFAAAYHILPRVTGIEISLSKIKLHFWLAMPGALLMSLPLAVAGVQQGLKLVDANVEFLAAAKAGMMMFRLTSLGEVLFALGALGFLLTVVAQVYQVCRSTVTQAIQTEPKLSGTEVRA